MDISIPYYKDMSRISNSNIGWFIKKGPLYLKNMLDGKAEGLKASFLEKGTMIHEYILQPEEFWKDYIILDFEIPKVKQQKDFCEFYVNLCNIEPFEPNDVLALKAYRQAYSNTKKDDIAKNDAMTLISTYQSYIEYLRNKDTKKVISFADLNMLKNIKSNLENHKKANELLYTVPDTFEVHNEFHINWEYPNASKLGDFPCKSLLDRVMIDHTNKKIVLIDLKTTADVYDFRHSIESFDYCRQLAFYWLAIHWYFKNELNLNIEDYEYETYIIAIQSHDGNSVKVFKFTPEAIESRLNVIQKAITEIAWHKENNLWEHSKSYYEGDGTEEY